MVDLFLFEQQFQRFRKYVIKNSGLPLVSFSSNPYTEKEEGYKYKLYRDAREKLKFENWQEADIGKGKIVRSVIAAIELKNNNLVQWQSRYGDEKRPHHSLYASIEQPSQARDYDLEFYFLYRGLDDANAFNRLIALIGRKYSLIAYLFFLKNRSLYMPIAPTYFDKAFSLLGVDFSTNQKCSWNNYSNFNNILSELKILLSSKMQGDVSLLDAHSFAWTISHIEDDSKLHENEYFKLPTKEREAVVKARVGQGYFRDLLLEYWNSCAVTGCKENSVLRASHIKPWSKCDLQEAVDLFNGLLLSPNLDAAFDRGLISFDDEGRILISSLLQDVDAQFLGIFSSLYLRRIDHRHKPYLDYHREFIFQEN